MKPAIFNFQKKDLLTVENSGYQNTLTSLYRFLSTSDSIKKDATSKLLDLNIEVKTCIKSHQTGIIAGIEEISYLCTHHLGITTTAHVRDGESIDKGQKVISLFGTARNILASERTVLNILQRMSGIATKTHELAKKITPVMISATRKTPWMGLDKKAVSLGGGLTHRLSLEDGILIKDNHLSIIKKIYSLPTEEAVIKKTVDMVLTSPLSDITTVELEVKTEKEAWTFFDTLSLSSYNFTPAMLFDNFTPKAVLELLNTVRKKYNLNGIILEASGGITEENIQDWADTTVDFISLGSLTHSTRAFDLSLDIL